MSFLTVNPYVCARGGEVHFFDKDENYAKGFHWYRNKMPSCWPNQLVIEKSPKYFVYEAAPGRVQNMNKSIMLMAIFKDPAKRLISDYTNEKIWYGHNIYKHIFGPKYPSFEKLVFDEYGNVNEAYEAVQVGIYVKHLKRWLQYFPWKQIHIIDGDKFIKDPALTLQV